MKIKLNWTYFQGEFDTKKIKLVCIEARGKRVFGPDEIDASLSIRDGDSGPNFNIAEIHTGDTESANKLCKEIVRRFNNFPEELKK